MFNQDVTSVNEPLAQKFFSDPSCRPTVAGLLVWRQEGIILVHSSKGVTGAFIPPQGGVEEGESLSQALIREVSEELPGAAIDRHKVHVLGNCINEIPPERREPGGPDKKMIFWVVARLRHFPQGLNSENTTYCQVWNRDGLIAALKLTRAEKRAMILEAVARAHELNRLAWYCGPDGSEIPARIPVAA